MHHNYRITILCIAFVGVGRAQQCDTTKAACRASIDASSNGNAVPDFKPGKCDYEKNLFWLIPGDADNSTCTRPEVIARGVKIRMFNDTVKITPNPIRLPGCFNMTFDVEILDSISTVPRSFIGRNEFQLYELPEIEKMNCQNASNNGCGGFGNNCIYCDICEQLKRIENRTPGQRTEQQEKWLSQFDDVKCPSKAGVYTVTRQLCFNDYSVFDKDHNCEIDFLEDLAKTSDGKTNADTIKQAFKALQSKGSSTLVARFYLSHNVTQEQQTKKLQKESEIEKTASAELAKQRANKADPRFVSISDSDFNNFKTWYIQKEKDKWHKEKYLPWLAYENELACLKVTFSVCDKQPIAVSPSDTSAKGQWWQSKSRGSRCP